MELKTGARCATKRNLRQPDDLSVSPMHIENRGPGRAGWVLGPRQGSGGAIWFVQHSNCRVAAYYRDELVIQKPVAVPEPTQCALPLYE